MSVNEPKGVQGPVDPTVAEQLLDQAEKDLEAANVNHDQIIRGGRFAAEVGESTDRLAKLVYDYVDYANPQGRTSLYGPASRGDVAEGGLGTGYALRPKHYTCFGVVTKDALAAGVKEIKQRVRADAEPDLPARNIAEIVAAGRAAGVLGANDAAALAAVSQAAENLLEWIVQREEQRERELNRETVVLDLAELRQAFPPGEDGKPTLEQILVQTVVEPAIADPAQAAWHVFFARELALMQAGAGLAFLPLAAAKKLAPEFLDHLKNNPIAKPGKIDDPMQHYLLVLEKRAKEASLVAEMKLEMTARAQANRLTQK
jgi:hypothetical protein